MANMFRLNHDGTVDRVDDTPDPEWLGPKYMRSAVREAMWVMSSYYIKDNRTVGERLYVHDCEVPDIIKMFDLLEP